MSLKKAERSDAYVMRVREMNGSPAQGQEVVFGAAVNSATSIDGQETALGNASASGNRISADFNGYQPKAFAFTLAQEPASAWAGNSISSRMHSGNLIIKRTAGGLLPIVKTGVHGQIVVMSALGQVVRRVNADGKTAKSIRLPSGTHIIMQSP